MKNNFVPLDYFPDVFFDKFSKKNMKAVKYTQFNIKYPDREKNNIKCFLAYLYLYEWHGNRIWSWSHFSNIKTDLIIVTRNKLDDYLSIGCYKIKPYYKEILGV